MYVLHIEHSVPDYDTWRRQGFDSDPLGRRQMGVHARSVRTDGRGASADVDRG